MSEQFLPMWTKRVNNSAVNPFTCVFRSLLLFGCFFQRVYGNFGMKPDDVLIESYEHFVLGNSEDLKATQMVTVSRCKLINILRGVFKNPILKFLLG